MLGLAVGEKSILVAEVISTPPRDAEAHAAAGGADAEGGSFEATHLAEFVFPQGLTLQQPEALGLALADFLKDNHFSSRHAVVASVSVTSSRAPSVTYRSTAGGSAARARPSRSAHQAGLPGSPRWSVTAPQATSTPASFFLPRRSTSHEPPSRSSGPGTWSTSVTRSLLR